MMLIHKEVNNQAEMKAVEAFVVMLLVKWSGKAAEVFTKPYTSFWTPTKDCQRTIAVSYAPRKMLLQFR